MREVLERLRSRVEDLGDLARERARDRADRAERALARAVEDVAEPLRLEPLEDKGHEVDRTVALAAPSLLRRP